MLYTQSSSRVIAVLAICMLLAVGLPARCESASEANQAPVGSKEVTTVTHTKDANDTPQSIAQVIAAGGTAQLNPVTLMTTSGRHKEASPLADSLWGNLILELAYERDQGLKKIAKRIKIANFGTMAGIATVAGGTLGQVIAALGVLNPQPGHLDSYSPLIMGTAFSSLTVMIFLARLTSNHVLTKQLTNRQQEIKYHLENILALMEASEGNSPDATKELTDMIGERACREWVALYQSSHKLAMTSPRKFSMLSIPAGND